MTKAPSESGFHISPTDMLHSFVLPSHKTDAEVQPPVERHHKTLHISPWHQQNPLSAEVGLFVLQASEFSSFSPESVGALLERSLTCALVHH